jgi:AraC-like DNA-binding protein
MSADSPLDGTVSVLVLRALLHGARVAGIEPRALFARAGLPLEALDPKKLSDPDARVPARIAVRLWELLPEASARPHFGLWLAEQVKDAPLTVASWFILSSSSVELGLSRTLAFQRLLHDQANGMLEQTDEQTTYVHRVGDAGFRAPPAAIEFGFAQLVLLVRRATGRPVVPSRIAFQHASPENSAEHRRFFGASPVFNAARDELAFDRVTRELPVVSADPALGELVQAHAERLLAELPSVTTWASRVLRALGTDLSQGNVGVDQVARALSVPTRTLQRRLQEEGTSFEDVADRLKRDLAERYLCDRRLGIQETAFLLGYSDVSAFHRAFSRWTGMSPSRYRESRGAGVA